MFMNIVLYLFEGDYSFYIEKIQQGNCIFYYLPDGKTILESAENFLSESQLLSISYDYLIIMTRDAQKSSETKEQLCQNGISIDKILEYYFFEMSPSKSAVENFWNSKCQMQYDKFVFGMSHSYGGLLPELLRGSTYVFSAPSMDLYYHYLVLKDICVNYDISKVKKIVFELPYYIFNYDLSRSKKTFLQRINYYYYYGDYHNFGQNENEKKILYMFEKLNSLCDEPIYKRCGLKLNREYKKNTRLERFLRKGYAQLRYLLSKKDRHLWTKEEKQRILQMQPNVWYRTYSNTISENIEVWKKIRKLLMHYENVEIYVCVFPFNPIFLQKNEKKIREMKQVFYQEIAISKQNIVDCMTCYEDRADLFSDECHLNSLGSYQFSKKLRSILG